jgi:hypothetical protein
MCILPFAWQDDPHDSLNDEWMADVDWPPFMLIENIMNKCRVGVEVDMVGLVKDVFVVVDQICKQAHNISWHGWTEGGGPRAWASGTNWSWTMTRSQVTGWNPLEGSTKSSCGKLRLGGTLPASNSRKG